VIAGAPPLPWRVRVQPERMFLLCGAAALVLGGGWCAAVAAGLSGPACAWKSGTGWPCFGCGATRAVLLLTEGHWLEAVRMNPALVLALPLLAVAGGYCAAVLVFRLEPWRPRALAAVPWRWLAVAVLAANWIYLLAAGRA